MRLFGWFRRKPETPPQTPEERFKAALNSSTAAWKEYETHTHWKDRIRPWMDWNERRMDLTRMTRERVG